MNTNRIPNGTRVSWKARYEEDPRHEGVVLALVKKGKTFPHGSGDRTGCRNISAPVYVVKIERTPTGRVKSTPKLMFPYASRLEEQNPDALRQVR